MNTFLRNWVSTTVTLIIAFWSVSALAGPSIRMYEMNNRDQQRRVMIGGSAEHQPGCHELLWSKEVFRFAQIGYAWCSLHSEGECADESVIPAVWESGTYHKYNIKEGELQTRLYPGDKWIVQVDGRKVKSWYCEAK